MIANEGSTSLHYSARYGSYKSIKFLVSMGTDIKLKTKQSINCLHIAANYGHLNLCKTLINKYQVDVQLPDNNGWTALHFSARSGSYEIVKYFTNMGIEINLKTKDRMNCLHIAADYGHLNLCKILINEYNVDKQVPDNDGWTALHFSARSGSNEIVKYFTNMGIEINLKTKDGMNCLHIAADYGHLNLCKTLINEYNVDKQVPDNDGWTALHFSARNGSYEVVKFFINMGIDTNLKGTDGMNCLHIAAHYGHLNLCKTLINKYNVDVQLPDNDEWTALHFSAGSGSYETIKYFINMGIDINLKTKHGMNCLHIAADCGHTNLCKTLMKKHNLGLKEPNDNGWTALHYSAKNDSYELVKFFTDMGMDTNLKATNGMNCLHIAAHYGHLNLCKVLINKYNVDVQLPDNNGWTALHFSARNGSYEIVKYFINMGIDINLKTKHGMNCLHIAADCGHTNLCKTLIKKHNLDLEKPNDDGWTALHYSAKNDSYELVKFFTDMGIDTNLKATDGITCLHIAAHYGHLDLCKTLINKYNVDVQLPDNKGWTALHFSARSGSYEIVKYFTNMGIEINLTANGKSCLHIAADYGHLNLCKTLINEYNVDKQVPDNDGWTALHYSAKNDSYEIVKYFTNMGIEINLKTKDGMNCLHIAALCGYLNLCKTLINKYNVDVQLPDNNGWTALHFSARSGSYEIVKYFTNMGIEINLKTKDGMNCLHIAADYGHLNLCKMLINEYNVDKQVLDNDGWTALHFSARNGSYEVVKFFIDMGIDTNLKGTDGMNCLHIAANYRHLNLCKTLINKYNVDVQLPDNDEWTALHFSAGSGSYETVKYFINMGIDINLKTKHGMNCLHIAADCGHTNLCKTLMKKHNLDLEEPNDNGWTALHYSAKNDSYELVKFFTDMGMDTNLKATDGMNCLHIAAHYGHLNLCKMLINEHNVDPQLPDNEGWTALHFSARSGSYEIVKYFTNMGIEINLKTKDGMNCLHIAAFYGYLNLCKTLINKYNVDVQLPDNKEWTALHFSARGGSYEVVKYFTNMGIEISLKTKDGMNCLHIAADYGHLNLCKTLINEYNVGKQVPDNDGWTALHFSARNGSYEVVKFFIDMGIDTNLKATDGMNCLHIAAHYGHLNLCKTLINKYNVDVQLPDNDGWTALHFSAGSGSYEIVKYFINMGIDINLKTKHGMNCLHIAADCGHTNLCKTLIKKHNLDLEKPNDDGWTALHYSAKNDSYELVKFFTDMGIDTNLKATDGMNCLHIAAHYGHLNLCKTLISKYNVDAQLRDNDGWTALHFSALSGSYEIVKYFTNMGIEINLKTKDGMNCLHIAALYGYLNLCKTLINKYNVDVQLSDNKGWTALHFSPRSGSYEIVKYFIDMGIDINRKKKDGANCLHIASQYGHLNLCKTFINKHKFDVNVSCYEGWNALHFSVIHGSKELLNYFINMGIDINLKTKAGRNCLHIAAEYGHLDMCKTLINKYNIDVQVPDNDGWTGLHYSVKNGNYELVKLFVNMGIDINFKTNNGTNCLHIAAKHGHLNLCQTFINNHNFDVQTSNNDECTALHFSAMNGSFDLFSYILNNGSEIYGKTKNMRNVLHLPSLGGHFDICNFVLKYFIKDYEDHHTKKQYMLNSNSYRSQVFYKYKTIFLHAMDVDGNTYLHLAAKGNGAKICQLLLRYDTDIITLLNKEDKTAWEIAKDNGRQDVLNALKIEFERAGMFFLIIFN